MDIITAALAASMSGGGGGGTGTDDYNELSNKPKINGVTLAWNKSLSDIGAAAADETYTDAEVDTLLAGKVDKVDGKGLSTEDFTAAEKSKLAGIAAGAEVNVQANWAQTSSSADDFIKNKPTLGAAASKGVDSAPTASSTNLVTSGGVATALAAKLNTADVDDALSSTSTNPVKNRVVQAPIARLVDAGAKNLFQYNPVSVPEISYVVNGDGSITVTANDTTAVRILVLGLVTNLEDGKKYTLSGIAGGSYSSSYGFAVATSSATGKVFLSDGHTDFVKTSEMHQLELVVRAGQSWIKTFYPMLCTDEDYAISPEFVPYAPTNRELYEMILALQNAQNGG